MIINTRWWACILSTYDDVLPGKEEENKYENYGNFKFFVLATFRLTATYENPCVTPLSLVRLKAGILLRDSRF